MSTVAELLDSIAWCRTYVAPPKSRQITSKAEFYRLWNAGALGYKLRTWDSIEAFRDEPDQPPIVGLRQIGAAGGGAFWVGSTSEVWGQISDWQAANRKYTICEAAPDELGTLQGEVCRPAHVGWAGTMGLSRGLRMREAIAKGLLTPRSPAATRFLLKEYLSPASLDDLDAIFDLYPNATVEFTCYELNLDRGRNTIFWEVRNY